MKEFVVKLNEEDVDDLVIKELKTDLLMSYHELINRINGSSYEYGIYHSSYIRDIVALANTLASTYNTLERHTIKDSLDFFLDEIDKEFDDEEEIDLTNWFNKLNGES